MEFQIFLPSVHYYSSFPNLPGSLGLFWQTKFSFKNSNFPAVSPARVLMMYAVLLFFSLTPAPSRSPSCSLPSTPSHWGSTLSHADSLRCIQIGTKWPSPHVVPVINTTNP